MTLGGAALPYAVQVWFARTRQRIGWAGITGVLVIVLAAVLVSLSWSAQRRFDQTRSQTFATVSPHRVATAPSTPARPAGIPMGELARAADIPLLLTQMEQAALSHGLEWRTAEYRVTPATPTQPGSLEVRCSLKGPYPKLRATLVQLIEAIPAFSIREFGVSRPNADVPDVEAKLVLAVFLLDGEQLSIKPDFAAK